MKKFIIETNKPCYGRGERLKIKGFRTSEAMHKFLNTGSNALSWRESDKDLKPGTYAYAGGQWHNIKDLDPCLLAHI
jgi:hypothetical protein